MENKYDPHPLRLPEELRKLVTKRQPSKNWWLKFNEQKSQPFKNSKNTFFSEFFFRNFGVKNEVFNVFFLPFSYFFLRIQR